MQWLLVQNRPQRAFELIADPELDFTVIGGCYRPHQCIENRFSEFHAKCPDEAIADRFR